MKPSTAFRPEFIVFVLFLTTLTLGCGSSSPSFENNEPSDAQQLALIPEDQVRLSNDPEKTEIFRDAGLGLFIHWGPNSQMGTEISWPLHKASDDYIEKYYALAETFNPDQFDPDDWASLAKLAGIECVVFTTKHHDGFAMFDTAYSDLKITNSPDNKDITTLLVDAFRRQDLLIGFYYCPGDFRYQYVTKHPLDRLMAPDFESTVPFGPLKKSFVDYECGQIKELLSNYGDILML
jgi:alpha-L-fucosidase